MDQDCRRLMTTGGLNELLLPKVKNIGKTSCFLPSFLHSHRKLACHGDGWQTVPLKDYRQILNKTVTPMIIISFGTVTGL